MNWLKRSPIDGFTSFCLIFNECKVGSVSNFFVQLEEWFPHVFLQARCLNEYSSVDFGSLSWHQFPLRATGHLNGFVWVIKTGEGGVELSDVDADEKVLAAVPAFIAWVSNIVDNKDNVKEDNEVNVWLDDVEDTNNKDDDKEDDDVADGVAVEVKIDLVDAIVDAIKEL